MDDPRVQRTRESVFGSVRRLLADGSGEPLTFSRISDDSGVARKTLYVHWPTVAAIVADVLLAEYAAPEGDRDAGRVESARAFLQGVRGAFADPGVRAAMAFLIAAAPTDPAAADALCAVTARRAAEFAGIVGREDAAEALAESVGPLLFSQFVAQSPASDETIERLIDRLALGRDGA